MTKVEGKLAQRMLGILVLVTMMAGIALPAFGQKRRTHRRAPRLGRYTRPVQRPTPPRSFTINAGVKIRVRMNEQISSENARTGDRFTTTVVDPVYVNGVEVIPAGSRIEGRVTEAHRAERQSKAGTIAVQFISLQLPDGSTRIINGSLADLSNETVTYDSEGQVKGRSSTNRNIVFIGGGATVGALIGAIAGGGKGAGIGILAGAGLGVAGAYLAKGQEAVVKPGTEFGVVLNQSIALPASNVRPQ
jgi:hypothetical protein